MELVNDQIYKNYIEKMYQKIFVRDSETRNTCEDINNLVVFFNYCFQSRNNFFVPDFNQRLIYRIGIAYNLLKTNIVSSETIYDVSNLLDNINLQDLKSIKFILIRYTKNYATLQPQHERLCSVFTKKSAENCAKFIETYMASKQR